MDTAKDLLSKRREKAEGLKAEGINLFPNGFTVDHTIGDIGNHLKGLPDEQQEDDRRFTVAGRMMAINRFGKSAFVRFKDRTGHMQAYVRKDKVGDRAYDLFKRYDVGDFVRIHGSLFRTKTGEWTLLAVKIDLLCKSTRPLPEKFHGLKDPEKRYRQRYIDLIMNPEVQRLFIARSRIIQAMRAFFLSRDYLEVETPMMQPIPGGANARPFVTHHNALGVDMYLRIAPELYLKRLVVGGFERVYEINRNFRNEGLSTRHNPEFTMLELYHAYAGHVEMMDLTEDLLRVMAEALLGSTRLDYQGEAVDLGPAFRRAPLEELVAEHNPGLDRDRARDREHLASVASAAGVAVDPSWGAGKLLLELFEKTVEDRLRAPTFVTGFPAEVSPLARAKDGDPFLTDRFELFICGRELANGFSELNDPEEQARRFRDQVEKKTAGDQEAMFYDGDYVRALEYGMPPAGGLGIGVDRVVMLFTDQPSIRDVLLFPQMRPESEDRDPS